MVVWRRVTLVVLLLVCWVPQVSGQASALEEIVVKQCNLSVEYGLVILQMGRVMEKCWWHVKPATRFGLKAAFRRLTLQANSTCKALNAYDGEIEAPCPIENQPYLRLEDTQDDVDRGLGSNGTVYYYNFVTSGHFAGEMFVVADPKGEGPCSVNGVVVRLEETSASRFVVVTLLLFAALGLVGLAALICPGVFKGKRSPVVLPVTVGVWTILLFLFAGLFLAFGYSHWSNRTGKFGDPILVVLGWLMCILSLLLYIFLCGLLCYYRQQMAAIAAQQNRSVASNTSKSVRRAKEKAHRKLQRQNAIAVGIGIALDVMDLLGDFMYAVKLLVLSNDGYTYVEGEGVLAMLFVVIALFLYTIPQAVRGIWLLSRDEEKVPEWFMKWSRPMLGWVTEDVPQLIFFLSSAVKLNCRYGFVEIFHLGGIIIGIIKKLSQNIVGDARKADSEEIENVIIASGLS